MKGYKAFDKGLICKGKQYSENTVFEEEKAEICESGMHFCKKPLDVLNYYPLVNEKGEIAEFAEVESLDECKTNDNEKYCTKKLKIGTKISFAELVKASVNFYKEVPTETKVKASRKNEAQIGSSGDLAKIGSSGYGAKIGSSGNGARIGSSGDWARIGSSGDCVRIGSSGDCARIGSSGNGAMIGSSGDWAKIGSSGDWAKIGSSGDWVQIGSSGYGAKIGSSGDWARIGSSGDCARIGSSGDCAKIGSSGNGAQINSNGKHAVICCAGEKSIAKGKIGSWITLSEWKYSKEEKMNIPVCVKTEKIDGERIKEDTFYKLVNGEFVEA